MKDQWQGHNQYFCLCLWRCNLYTGLNISLHYDCHWLLHYLDNNGEVLSNQEASNEIDLVCSDGFFREENSSICLPSCHSWYQYSREVTIAADVVVVLSAVLGFSVAVIAIVLSCLCHKRM